MSNNPNEIVYKQKRMEKMDYYLFDVNQEDELKKLKIEQKTKTKNSKNC